MNIHRQQLQQIRFDTRWSCMTCQTIDQCSHQGTPYEQPNMRIIDKQLYFLIIIHLVHPGQVFLIRL